MGLFPVARVVLTTVTVKVEIVHVMALCVHFALDIAQKQERSRMENLPQMVLKAIVSVKERVATTVAILMLFPVARAVLTTVTVKVEIVHVMALCVSSWAAVDTASF